MNKLIIKESQIIIADFTQSEITQLRHNKSAQKSATLKTRWLKQEIVKLNSQPRLSSLALVTTVMAPGRTTEPMDTHNQH